MTAHGLILLTPLPASLVTAREYHVALDGSDRNEGSAEKPFQTISAAAQVAQPGDVVTVHAGVYREGITPPRGGTSDASRIVYQAAPGEEVELRGSEIVSHWTPVSNRVWKAEIPNTLFGDFNPFADVVGGDWFDPKGRKHHSQGGACAHNLFAGVLGAVTDERHTPYFQADSTEKVADQVLNVGDDRFHNNMFEGRNGSRIDPGWWEGMKTHPTWRFGYGLWIHETRPQAPQTGGNIYCDEALPYPGENAVVMKTRPDVHIEESDDEVFLHITIDPGHAKAETRLVTSALLGKAQVPDLPSEDYDGAALSIDTDDRGLPRDTSHPTPGPFEDIGPGRVKLKVW